MGVLKHLLTATVAAYLVFGLFRYLDTSVPEGVPEVWNARILDAELRTNGKLNGWMILENPTPVDITFNQFTRLSVRVVACPDHKQQLCLWVAYNDTILRDIPLTQNRGGQSYDLPLCFVLDGANNKLSVINAADNTVYTTVTDVDFDRPMWVMMYVGDPVDADVTGELISGHNVTGSFNGYNR